jgi:hypothetical protein
MSVLSDLSRVPGTPSFAFVAKGGLVALQLSMRSDILLAKC